LGSLIPPRLRMAKTKVKGSGTKQSPWVLKTPPGTSEFEAYRDDALDPAALIVQVGKTEVRYQLRGRGPSRPGRGRRRIRLAAGTG